MKEIKDLFNELNKMLPNRVFYGVNVETNTDTVELPFIVYQEIKRKNTTFIDDQPLIKESVIQISLLTTNKDTVLEKLLEDKLEISGFNYTLVSEFLNLDLSFVRVYEVKIINLKERN